MKRWGLNDNKKFCICDEIIILHDKFIVLIIYFIIKYI
jgi:hypothetical protein